MIKMLQLHGYKFAIACFLIFLTSCGGGGSGGSVGQSQTQIASSARGGSVVVDTTPINLKYVRGDEQTAVNTPDAQANLTRIITIDGIDLNNPPDNFILGYFSDSGSTVNHLNIFFEQLDSKRLRARIQPAYGLAPGEYIGSLQLVACFAKSGVDECEKHLDGSPTVKVPYKITVFSRLFLQDLYVSTAYANQGSTTPILGSSSIEGVISLDDIVAQITYLGNTTDWLSVTKTITGFTYSVNAKNAPVGTHTATVNITSSASNQSVTKTIELRVGINSFSGIQTARNFEITDQTIAQDLTSEILVGIDNGDITIPWKATSNVPWITLDKNSGVTGETITYRISPSYVATMPTEIYTERKGSFGTITISNESTLTIAPLSISVEAHRMTSELNSVLSAPMPINAPGYPMYFDGKNIFGGTIFETTGPSPLTIQRDYIGRGIVETVPTVAGVYTISTKNALGIPTRPVTATFLATSQHTYNFIAAQSYKRSMAYDQTTDALYVVDKTNSQLLRFKHTNGAWASSQLDIPNVSDLGLSQDQKRLYASQTTGVINQIAMSNFGVARTSSYGKPFPEYKTLSQNLTVIGLGEDFIPISTEYASFGVGQFSGIVSFSSTDNLFLPVSGYGYKPERGGWFVRSNKPDNAFFIQADIVRTPFDTFGDYAGVQYSTRLTPTAYQLAYGTIGRFDKLDQGLIANDYGLGLIDRKRFSSVSGGGGAFGADLANLPPEYQTVGSAVSSDWKFIYILAYPLAAINGDLSTTLKPRVFVYQLTSDYFFPTVSLLPNYFEFDNFPTCRRPSDASCLLDTLSSVSMDGRTLFFAGDAGIAIVPIPSSLNTGVQSIMNKTTQSKTLSKSTSTSSTLKQSNSFRFVRH
jgi:hypothetical protein